MYILFIAEFHLQHMASVIKHNIVVAKKKDGIVTRRYYRMPETSSKNITLLEIQLPKKTSSFHAIVDGVFVV